MQNSSLATYAMEPRTASSYFLLLFYFAHSALPHGAAIAAITCRGKIYQDREISNIKNARPDLFVARW
jgi:hypothetical protein